MKNKQLIIPVMLLLGVFFFMALASASITFIKPTTGQYINGTVNFNVTTAVANALMCNWSTTANANFLGVLNSSAGQTAFNQTYNTASLTEVASTTLTVNCSNATASEVGSITIGVDNTAPTCSFLLDMVNIPRQSGLGVTPTQKSTDTTTLTYVWNLTNSESKQKATYTTSEPTFSNGDLEDLGEHTIRLTVTDRVGKTATCTDTIYVKSANTDKQDVIAQTSVSQAQSTSSKMWIIWIILGVLVVVIFAVGFWIATESTKKRRR